MNLRILLLLLLLACGFPVQADDTPLEFSDPQLQQRYQHLLEETRCLVCQNQTLAASSADLAGDLRLEIYQMIEQGMDDEAIIRFLVDRYGDFVLYKPPLKESTWLLWFTPFVLLLVAVAVVVYFIRTRKPAAGLELSAEEQARLSGLLGRDGEQS